MANAHSAHSAHSLSFPCMKPFFFRWVPFLFVLGGGLVGHQSQSLSVVPDADRTQVIHGPWEASFDPRPSASPLSLSRSTGGRPGASSLEEDPRSRCQKIIFALLRNVGSEDMPSLHFDGVSASERASSVPPPRSKPRRPENAS